MSSYYMQHMLLQYGRQLTTARRLARHRQAMRLANGYVPELSPDEKRKALVGRVTSEIIENLLLAGSENPIVVEVLERLRQALGEDIIFRYPPGELDVLLFRHTEDGVEEEIAPEEKAKIMGLLWHIAEQAVSETML
ncbi:MAG: hypothetical protein DELT_00963 [Desulfovibrio sp.]